MKNRILSIILTFVVIVPLFCMAAQTVSAATESGICGANGANLTWEFDTETGLLTISGTGAMADWEWDWDWEDEHPTWYTYKSAIKTVNIESGVTSIGDFAFYECYNLKDVTIPDSVTTVGDGAFVFCFGVTSVTIPSKVTSIGEMAFFDCTKLTSATFEGDAPSNFEKRVFDWAAENFTIYYYEGAQGWTTPEWNSYKTKMIPKSGETTYTVTFNANGGTVTPKSASTNKSGKLSALPTPTREGYTFDGWFTEASGGTEVTAGNVFTANAAVYAHWTANLKEIKITAMPAKISYAKGEKLNLAGIAVTATYTDNSTKAVTGYTANPADGSVLNIAGIQTVTVSYTENGITKTANFDVTAVMYGDLNGNNSINADDLVVLAKHIAEIAAIQDNSVLTKADVNGDGKVNIADLIRLSRWLANIDTAPLGTPEI